MDKNLTAKVNDGNTNQPADSDCPAPVYASRCLVESSKYCGKYVAQPNFNDRTIITFGDDRSTVTKEAEKKGFKNPVVFYVPTPEDTLGASLLFSLYRHKH
jgi:hypothetical protein